MSRKSDLRWVVLVAANAAVWCVLSLKQSDGANPRPAGSNGPSATEQLGEVIVQLKDIKAELRQLNQFRQTGSLPIPNP